MLEVRILRWKVVWETHPRLRQGLHKWPVLGIDTFTHRGGLNFHTGPPWDLWWPMTNHAFLGVELWSRLGRLALRNYGWKTTLLTWYAFVSGNMPGFGKCRLRFMDYSTYSQGLPGVWLHHSKNSNGKPKIEATDYALTWGEFFFFKINIHGLFTISIGFWDHLFGEWSLWPVALLIDVGRSLWAMVLEMVDSTLEHANEDFVFFFHYCRICIEVL